MRPKNCSIDVTLLTDTPLILDQQTMELAEHNPQLCGINICDIGNCFVMMLLLLLLTNHSTGLLFDFVCFTYVL
jgi:hypothetical protein